eukprot:TRINITY_DN11881_c0_g1_i1.p1 TRINITY_DN11881_c0_g1~~TRINITY_DN11881_c0_g1_i1.p1  ORF type:complete len:213 (-),score=54.91 TRINITY_DN11881_c0_g1_i1:13-651(-)
MEAYDKECDQILKILLIGESGVGKSSILMRYCDDTFTSTYLSTIGVDFKIKTLEMEDKKKINLQLWDTAGQERFRTITTSYYRGAQGIILVFDLTDRTTFSQISNWVEEIRDNSSPNVKLILVGNKKDLKDKIQVTEIEAQELAKQLNCEYIETSAKTDENIDTMIYRFSEYLLDKDKKQPNLPSHVDDPNKSGIQFSSITSIITCGTSSIL